MLVDDHPLFREGLRSAIDASPDLMVAGEASGAVEALQKLSLFKPDVLITDLCLGDHSGLDLIVKAIEYYPNLPVLVVSMLSSRDEVLQAIECGAKGYLTKFACRDEVLLAIREVWQGRSYLHSSVAHVVFERVRRPVAPVNGGINLTSRELEMLQLLGTGVSPGDVAERLVLSVSTVKTHMRSLFRKLEVSTRTQLVLKAIEKGLIQSPHRD